MNALEKALADFEAVKAKPTTTRDAAQWGRYRSNRNRWLSFTNPDSKTFRGWLEADVLAWAEVNYPRGSGEAWELPDIASALSVDSMVWSNGVHGSGTGDGVRGEVIVFFDSLRDRYCEDALAARFGDLDDFCEEALVSRRGGLDDFSAAQFKDWRETVTQ